MSLLNSFRQASSETKSFVITVAILVVIVIGSCIYSYTRISSSRSTSNSEMVTPAKSIK